MIQIEPFLLLARLVVVKDGKRAYDEPFHAGVNIIRSEKNSAGKSTRLLPGFGVAAEE
jgi:hypothetical protein